MRFRFPYFKRQSLPHEIDDAVLTLTERDTAERIEWPLKRTRAAWFVWFGLVMLGLYFGRLVYLNVVKGDEYQLMAERNSVRSLVVFAPRGIIYDRFREPLVTNEPSLDAVLIPNDMPREPQVREALLERIRQFFQPDENIWKSLEERVASGNLEALIIRPNLPQDLLIEYLTHREQYPGVTLLKTAERQYVDGSVFSHIIGYEGKIRADEYAELKEAGYVLTDSLGKQGIEKSYEKYLRGIHGQALMEVDALGQLKKELGVVPPQKGSDIYLALDADLQREASSIMERVLGAAKLKRGALIALDPRNGAVRALISFPSYDNNLFAGGIGQAAYTSLANDPNKPLFNRTISGEYPPGSTIKPILAGAALAEGIISPETTLESRGGIQVGKSFFGDWKAHGFTDLRRAIAVSSDVYFYSIGGGYGSVRGLGMEKMKAYESRFGWGTKTGIDLPGEQDGFLPTPAWKQSRFGERWYVGDDYNASIGQGYVTATPLQVLNAIAAIANGGTLYQPRMVEAIEDISGVRRAMPPVVIRNQVLAPSLLKVIREGMRQTVTEGTAQSLNDLDVPVAGKTGTAQFGGGKATHGWFVSFAPYENPELAVVVLVEDQAEQSTYHAVPITKALYSWYFHRQKNGSDKP